MDKFLSFPLKHPADRDTGPYGYDLGNVFSIDFLFKHFSVFLKAGEFLIGLVQVISEFRSLSVSDLRNLCQIPFSFSLLFFNAKLLLMLLDLSYCLDQILFILPVGFHFKDFIFQVIYLGFKPGKTLFGCRIRFFF